jgi:hypothetical protein
VDTVQRTARNRQHDARDVRATCCMQQPACSMRRATRDRQRVSIYACPNERMTRRCAPSCVPWQQPRALDPCNTPRATYDRRHRFRLGTHRCRRAPTTTCLSRSTLSTLGTLGALGALGQVC